VGAGPDAEESAGAARPSAAPAGAHSGAGLSAPERRALDALDLVGLVAFLRELIAIPSLGGDESPAQLVVGDWMRRVGLSADIWQINLQALASHPDYSAEVARAEALGVVGWLGGEEPAQGRDLLLNGHVDVVPAGDESAWTAPPFAPTVRDGCVYGRGAADMKGGLCCALFAVKAIHEAGIGLLGRLSVASVVGEEDGGTGTLAMLLRGHRADGAIVVEPTRLAVVPAQAGSLMFRLIVHGRSAHASVREEGVSAVEKFAPLFVALRDLEAQRCGVSREGPAAVAGDPRDPLFARYRLPWPIEVGTLHSGDWGSSVPDTLVAEGRYGVAVGEEPAAARQAFEEAIARAAAADGWLRAHPPEVEWWGGRFDPALTDAADPVVTTLGGAVAAVSGVAPPLEGVPYGADLRLLVNVGRIPSVLFGPGDVRAAHMPDEHVPVGELHTAARALVLTALRFCGVRE
jgi:acetylornithine deacetylase